jgi:SAM-dependent methyltransferase
MVGKRNKPDDAYGQMLLAQHSSGEKLYEIIEREDNYIDTGSSPGQYISGYREWSPAEKQAINHAKGRVLDIGCGAGRHSLYLQDKGLEITGIDNSPGAIKVCKARGLKKALNRPIEEVSKFGKASFDTILMMGNNFGLLGDPERAKRILKEFHRITTDDASIIAGTFNPYATSKPDHLRYHKFNRSRGRMPGQLTFRARFGSLIGEWFDYLCVSPEEMSIVLTNTGWHVAKFFGNTNDRYFALIRKDETRVIG